jgi:hypothetical protein
MDIGRIRDAKVRNQREIDTYYSRRKSVVSGGENDRSGFSKTHS